MFTLWKINEAQLKELQDIQTWISLKIGVCLLHQLFQELWCWFQSQINLLGTWIMCLDIIVECVFTLGKINRAHLKEEDN